MVSAGEPVEFEYMYTPLLMVATTLLVPFHPAFTASVRKSALIWLDDIVKANWFDFPYPSLIEIVPLGFPNNVRTFDAFMLIDAVALRPNSTLTWESEIGPDTGSVIAYFSSAARRRSRSTTRCASAAAATRAALP